MSLYLGYLFLSTIFVLHSFSVPDSFFSDQRTPRSRPLPSPAGIFPTGWSDLYSRSGIRNHPFLSSRPQGVDLLNDTISFLYSNFSLNFPQIFNDSELFSDIYQRQKQAQDSLLHSAVRFPVLNDEQTTAEDRDKAGTTIEEIIYSSDQGKKRETQVEEQNEQEENTNEQNGETEETSDSNENVGGTDEEDGKESKEITKYLMSSQSEENNKKVMTRGGMHVLRSSKVENSPSTENKNQDVDVKTEMTIHEIDAEEKETSITTDQVAEERETIEENKEEPVIVDEDNVQPRNVESVKQINENEERSVTNEDRTTENAYEKQDGMDKQVKERVDIKELEGMDSQKEEEDTSERDGKSTNKDNGTMSDIKGKEKSSERNGNRTENVHKKQDGMATDEEVKKELDSQKRGEDTTENNGENKNQDNETKSDTKVKEKSNGRSEETKWKLAEEKNKSSLNKDNQEILGDEREIRVLPINKPDELLNSDLDAVHNSNSTNLLCSEDDTSCWTKSKSILMTTGILIGIIVGLVTVVGLTTGLSVYTFHYWKLKRSPRARRSCSINNVERAFGPSYTTTRPLYENDGMVNHSNDSPVNTLEAITVENYRENAI